MSDAATARPTFEAIAFTDRGVAECVTLSEEHLLAGEEIAGPTLASLISPGTEVNGQFMGSKFPAYPGYAAVFRVDAVGDAVTDVQPGDVMFCTGPSGIGGHRGRQRCPRQAAIHVPAGLDPAVACHARLMGVSMSSLTRTVVQPPQRVVITGLGPIGHLAAQICHAAGYRVTAVDPMEQRRALLQDKGVVDVRGTVPVDDPAIKRQVALGLECSSVEQATVDLLRTVKPGGEVFQIGVPHHPRTDVTATALLEALFRGHATLHSGWEWALPRYEPEPFRRGCIFDNFAAALDWLAAGRIDVAGLYETVSPDDPQGIYDDLLNRRRSALSIVFDWSAG